MTSRILGKVAGFIASSLVLCACGGRAQSTTDGRAGAPSANAGAPSAGSNDATGGALATAGGATSAEAGAEAGESSSGAAGQPDAPTVDISGRWALFNFEDPVGVQLFQNGDSLSGRGCDVGAPPANSEVAPNLCGDIEGNVTANQAYFEFHFGDRYTPNQYDYIADVTVSADGTRMAGRFHGASDWLSSPTAWLRLPDGQERLIPSPLPIAQPEATGRYELLLLDATAGGAEYVPGTGYHLLYDRGKLSGDLGSFWLSEIAPPSADGQLLVGPVAETDPALPVSLSLDISAGVFTHVTATTGSGHEYEFSASVTQ